MTDRLDDAIRSMVVELVEASPPPPPARSVLEGPAPRRASWAWWAPLRPALVAALVLVVGGGGVVLGRYVFPASPAADEAVRVVVGEPAPEPRFSTADMGMGSEQRLLPASETIEPEVGPDLVGDVVAVGRIDGTDVEVFTWRIESDGIEGDCVQVVGAGMRETACSAQRIAPHLHTPYTFSHQGKTVVTWLVPAGTSVAALEVRNVVRRGDVGSLLLWQRPVGGVTALVVDEPAFELAFLTAWDVDRVPLVRFGFSSQGTVTEFPGAVEGALPDGRTYIVSGLQQGGERVEGIHGAVMIDFNTGEDTGESWVVGITSFYGGPSEELEPWWSGDTLVVPAGDRTVRIAVYDHLLERLGPEGRDLLARSIRGTSTAGLPVLELAAPLRFAADDEIPLQMEVAYETFAVRRGCDPRFGGVCSEDGLVQAIPLRLLVSGDPPPPPDTIRIESVGRPSVDPEHLEYHLRFRRGFDYLSTDIDHILTVIADGGAPEARRELGLEMSTVEWAEFQRRLAVGSRIIDVKRLVTGRAFDEEEEAREGPEPGGRLPTGPLFGGVWQDHLDGGLVKLAVTDPSALDLDALYALFERGAGDIVVIEQEYSLDQLSASRDVLSQRLQQRRVGANLGNDYSDAGVRIRLTLHPASHDIDVDDLLAGIPRERVVVVYGTESDVGYILPGFPLDI